MLLAILMTVTLFHHSAIALVCLCIGQAKLLKIGNWCAIISEMEIVRKNHLFVLDRGLYLHLSIERMWNFHRNIESQNGLSLMDPEKKFSQQLSKQFDHFERIHGNCRISYDTRIANKDL